MDERREVRISRLALLALAILVSLGLAWGGGTLASPHVRGRPVLLSRAAWESWQYLSTAASWLEDAGEREERLLRALGPLDGVDWPAPAGGWPESIYEQASLARAAAADLETLRRTARSRPVPTDLLATHEQVATYLDASADFGAAVLDYLGGPDEAKLPGLLARWQTVQEGRRLATTVVQHQHVAQGWAGVARRGQEETTGPAGTPGTTPVPTLTHQPGPGLATHTPLGGEASATPSPEPSRTPGLIATVGTPSSRGSATPAGATAWPGPFATHTPVRR